MKGTGPQEEDYPSGEILDVGNLEQEHGEEGGKKSPTVDEDLRADSGDLQAHLVP